MIIDVTGIELMPGNGGADCLANGRQVDNSGNFIECCCDECDYMMCCVKEDWKKMCGSCTQYNCPRQGKD